MRPEDDPRQTNFGDAIDDMRKRREEVIRNARSEPRPTVASTGPVSPDDKRRAVSRWKAGWLAWHESGMTGDGYDALLTSLVGASTLAALVEDEPIEKTQQPVALAEHGVWFRGVAKHRLCGVFIY